MIFTFSYEYWPMAPWWWLIKRHQTLFRQPRVFLNQMIFVMVLDQKFRRRQVSPLASVMRHQVAYRYLQRLGLRHHFLRPSLLPLLGICFYDFLWSSADYERTKQLRSFDFISYFCFHLRFLSLVSRPRSRGATRFNFRGFWAYSVSLSHFLLVGDGDVDRYRTSSKQWVPWKLFGRIFFSGKKGLTGVGS